jgi:hypothetical protein
LIGYESLYAKDSANYARAWIADYSPYLMFVVNEYFRLQNSNSLPSYGAQVAYKPSGSWTFKETVYYGPDQSNTSLELWRSFSDSIVEWKVNDDVTIAGDYQIGRRRMPRPPAILGSFYMGAAFPVRWHIGGPWAVAVRPEFYWDRNGLMTGTEQLVKAVTTTAEYKVPYK